MSLTASRVLRIQRFFLSQSASREKKHCIRNPLDAIKVRLQADSIIQIIQYRCRPTAAAAGAAAGHGIGPS
eukprot:2744432-Lingulodinium_polyedra.AAC.1